MSLLVLGIETSCDETSAAVLEAPRRLRSHVILSQDAHRVFGGVVPELAARTHLRTLDRVVATALEEARVRGSDLDLVAVTAGPGLVGALLVGVVWAKTAAWAWGKPVIGVHHMEAHLFATELEHPEAQPPFVALLVSGGHTMLLFVPRWGEYELLGQTRDDAAGEAFDKAAKLLGLGYPGGPEIERLAAQGDPTRVRLPRPLLHGPPEDRYDFSFSGLKTALRGKAQAAQARGAWETERPHLAAAFQAAVVDILVEKTCRAVADTGCRRVVLGGGVANSRALRTALRERLGDGELYAPSPRLSTDNAAMVARAGAFRFATLGESSGLDLVARADLPFPGLRRRAPVPA